MSERQRPALWLTLLWFLLPWLILLGTSQWVVAAESSSLAAVLRRERTLAVATLALTASLVPIVFAVWGRMPRGRSVAQALGGYWEGLMLGCSFVLCLRLFFLAKPDVPNDVMANAALAIAMSGLMWLLGAVAERVPRNELIGFRTRRTLADDAAWKEANARHGRRLRLASPVGLLGVFLPPYGFFLAPLVAVVVAVLFIIEDVRARVAPSSSTH